MVHRPELTELLRGWSFRTLLATRLTSQMADGAFQASLASAVLFSPEHQTTARDLAASFTVVLLPYSLIGPFAGVFLDRWRRQRVLVRGNLLRAAVVCLTAALLVALSPTHPAVYAVALVAVGINRFYLSALSAALPHVVAPTRLVLANSVSTTGGTIASLVGGGTAIGVRTLLGSSDAASAFTAVIAAGIYLGSSLIAVRLGVDELGPDVRADRAALREEFGVVLRGLRAGAAHIWHRRRARQAVAAVAGHRFIYGMSTVVTVLLYRNVFTDHGILKGGIGGLTEVFMLGGVGVLAAAVLTPWATARVPKEAWIVAGLTVAAVAALTLTPALKQAPYLVAAVFFGFSAQSVKICVDTIVQENIDETFLGRVFSLYDMTFNLLFIVAALVGTFALPPDGRSVTAMIAIGVGYALVSGLYAAASMRRRAGLSADQLAAEFTPAGG